MTNHYIALVHKEADSDYGVMFPDFPGCISAGSTLEEAIRLGAEALAGHVALMRRDGESVPAPRSVEEIRQAGEDWVEWDGAMVTLVPLLPPAGRSVRVNISLDENLLAQIDAVTSNRSAFLAAAAQRALNG